MARYNFILFASIIFAVAYASACDGDDSDPDTDTDSEDVDDDSDQRCGENEEYTCGTACREATCTNPKPSMCEIKCKQGCFCKKGYVRDASRKCILIEKCPSRCRGPNEKYIDCPAGQCKPKTCRDLTTPPPCPPKPTPCPGGCICEDGYLRDSRGLCIKRSQCPKRCRRRNEIYECRVEKAWEKCEDRNKPPRRGKPTQCRCYCMRGYWRNAENECVKAAECPK